MKIFGRLVSVDRHGNPGKAFFISKRICVIGRNTDLCDVRIYRPEVSSLHTKIIVDENDYLWVENLSKTNGTLINGVKIDDLQKVNHHDLITVGTKSFMVQYREKFCFCNILLIFLIS